MERISMIEEMIKKMDEFWRTKKHVSANERGHCGCFAQISATPRRYRIHGGLGRII